MTAENTIQWMMDFHPNIYPTRKHCLNQLFCVIGNGYEWVDGELIDTDPDIFSTRYSFCNAIDRAVSDEESFWYKQEQMYRLLKEIDPYHVIPVQYQFRWYPIDPKYSYIVNFPENITPSWKAAISECRFLLSADGIEVPLNDRY